jgi:uncharacterized membrane protein
MACATHPDRDSVARCVTCGAELCADCSREVEGRFYCEAHAPEAQVPPPAAPAAEAVPPPPAPVLEGPAPEPAPGTDDRSKESPSLAALAYVLPCVLNLAGLIVPAIMLATETKKSRYMRFHALHAIFVFVAAEVVVVATYIIKTVIGHVPLVGGVVALLAWVAVWGAWLVLFIYLAVSAYNRKDVRLPVVTQFAADQADKMAV